MGPEGQNKRSGAHHAKLLGRGGREARRALRKASSFSSPVAQTPRRIPTYELLGEEALIAIEEQADWILQEIGVEFRDDPKALALFKAAGASVEGTRVRFDRGLARQIATSAPARFTMESRNAQRSFVLGGDHLVLMPSYGSPFVTDLERGRRYATLEDFQNFTKLSYLSPWLHHSGGTLCEPTDIPVNKRHLDMVYSHLRYSDKPFMGAVTAPDRAKDSLEMAGLVFGAEALETKVVIQANINVNSPLVYDGVMSSALRIYAAANQCVAISPGIFNGAMGPVTQAAVVAQTLAEALAGIALTQLVRKGCPVVFGSFHSTMNLRTGSLTFGSPEANLATMALAQIGRRLGVPVRSGGGQITAANSADGQAMQDSTSAMWATLLSGANQVWHAAGWLEGGLTMSYEKFVMDLNHCGMMLRMLQGLTVTSETLAREAYYQTEPGGNFLSTDHTLRHYADANYQSELPDPGPFESWVEKGCKTAEQFAQERWKTMLRDYEAPAMDPAIDEALLDFIARRKAAQDDAWY